MFFTSVIVGFAVGYIIGSIISLIIDIYDEYLTSQKAKQKAQEELGKAIRTLIIQNVSSEGQGETISAKAIGMDGEEVADITYHAHKGSSLYYGQRI